MNSKQLSWTLHPSRALSRGTYSNRSLKRPKLALLKSRVVSLVFALLPPVRILNSTMSWSLAPRLPLTFPPTTSSFFFMRSSRVSLLIGSSVTQVRKLSMLSRNSLDCLCPAALSLQQMVKVLHEDQALQTEGFF